MVDATQTCLERMAAERADDVREVAEGVAADGDNRLRAARPTTMSEPSEDEPLGTTTAVPGPTVIEDHDGRQ